MIPLRTNTTRSHVMAKNLFNVRGFTIIIQPCTFSDDIVRLSYIDAVEHLAINVSLSTKVPERFQCKQTFTFSIQIFTVPYSFSIFLLIDCALSQ